MEVRAGVLALQVVVAAPSMALAAQTIRGQLVDSISRTPLSGAFLTLVDSSGSERARAITDITGQFILTAPEPGSYRLRSKRIGFRPYFSAALALRSGETTTYNAAIDPIPIALREVVIAGERQCDVEAGASVAALWEEVREALAAVAWTSRSPAYWYQINHFTREVDTGGKRRRADSTWVETGFQQVPFRSAPVADLVAQGYVVQERDGTWTYHAPDADVLLSDCIPPHALLRKQVRPRGNCGTGGARVHAGAWPQASRCCGNAVARSANERAAPPRLQLHALAPAS